MARRGFGGSGDYSGLFSSFYSYNRNSQKAQQAADDQEAANLWANGLSTDDEWLNYIRARVASTTGDPKENEKWVMALRKYSTTIADKQAEQAYTAGGSITDLIAHYNDRAGLMEKDSNAYRELQIRINDLLDSQTGQTLQKQAEQIIEGISAGKNTYADLKTLLLDAKEAANPNSDLFRSIESQIKNVNETIKSNKVEGSFEELQYRYDQGKLSGGGYAKALRQMAVQFKELDPKRYYQILQAAVRLEKGGSGGGGTGGGGSAGSSKTLAATVDAIQAERNNVQALLGQFENGATKGIDPATGQTVTFSPGYVRELDLKLLGTYDKLSTAYVAKGDQSAAANTQKAKLEYLSQNIVAHNTISAEESWAHFYGSSSKVISEAMNNPDPYRARMVVQEIARNAESFAKGLTQETTAKYGGDLKRRLPGEEAGYGADKGLIDQVNPQFATNAMTMAQALKIISTPGVDDATAAAAMDTLGALGGQKSDGSPSNNPFLTLGARALEINGRVTGMETGDVQRIATKDGVIWARTQMIPVSIPSPVNPGSMVQVMQAVPVSYRDPMTGQEVQLKMDDKTSKMVDVFVDINGKPTKMSAIATLEKPSGFDTWVAQKTTNVDGVQLIAGRPVTASQMATLLKNKERTMDGMIASGLVGAESAFQSWQTTIPAFTDRYGNMHKAETWSQDIDTGSWYQGALPVRGIERDKNGMVVINEDGKPNMSWKAYATAGGVPVPYAGKDNKAMQDILNSDPSLTQGMKTRDVTGRVDENGVYDAGNAYWTPMSGGLSLGDRDSWWDPKAQAKKSDVEADKFRRVVEAQRRANRFGESQKDTTSDPVKGLASKLGILLDGAPAKPQSFDPLRDAGRHHDTKSVTGDYFKDLYNKTQAAVKAALPRVKLPDPKTTASGPSIGLNLNLGKTSQANAPTIKPPVDKGEKDNVAPPQRQKDDLYTPPPPKPTYGKGGSGSNLKL